MVKHEPYKYFGIMEECLSVMTGTFLKEEEF